MSDLMHTPVVIFLSALALVVVIAAMAICKRYSLTLAFRWLGLNVTLTPEALRGSGEPKE
jgi:hypothetical protein